MLSLQNAGKRFGPRVLFLEANWLIRSKEKTALVGANGTVVRADHGIAEIRIDGVDRAPRARRRGERVGQADITGVIDRGREGWVGSQARHDVGHRLVIVEAGAGADHRLALAEGIVRETDPWSEVRVKVRVGLACARRA